MATFLEELDDAVEGELLPADHGKLTPRVESAFRQMEDEILTETSQIIRGAMNFHKIDPEAKEPPADWVEELGQEKADEQFRLARYALMSMKNAPVAFKMATAVHASIVKARSSEKGQHRTLRVQLVQMPTAHVDYPKLEIGDER